MHLKIFIQIIHAEIHVILDGLLRQDHAEVCERVSYLEKKVRQQEDDIVCLKSAVADILRRLNQVEAEKGWEIISYVLLSINLAAKLKFDCLS